MHRCVHCGKLIAVGSKEIIEGCKNCGSHFFFYVREDKIKEAEENPLEMNPQEKMQIEKDIREMVGIIDEETPVILDLESVRVTAPGKYEIDLVNLFRKERPLIYKLEEGKYIIDLASTLNKDVRKLKEIRNPDKD